MEQGRRRRRTFRPTPRPRDTPTSATRGTPKTSRGRSPTETHPDLLPLSVPRSSSLAVCRGWGSSLAGWEKIRSRRLPFPVWGPPVARPGGPRAWSSSSPCGPRCWSVKRFCGLFLSPWGRVGVLEWSTSESGHTAPDSRRRKDTEVAVPVLRSADPNSRREGSEEGQGTPVRTPDGCDNGWSRVCVGGSARTESTTVRASLLRAPYHGSRVARSDLCDELPTGWEGPGRPRRDRDPTDHPHLSVPRRGPPHLLSFHLGADATRPCTGSLPGGVSLLSVVWVLRKMIQGTLVTP